MEQNQAHQPPRFTSSDVELAFRNNDTSQIETFIHEGLKLDEPMYNDKTPLQFSIIIENFEIANMLLKHGANPNAKIKFYGNKAIYSSTLWYSIECCKDISQLRFVELLLSYGADPNSIEHDGKNVISHVILFVSSAVVELLLKYGADPNTMVSDRDTLLERAVVMRRYDNAKILVKYGAKLTPLLTDLVRKRKEDGIFIASLQKYSVYFENIRAKKSTLFCAAEHDSTSLLHHDYLPQDMLFVVMKIISNPDDEFLDIQEEISSLPSTNIIEKFINWITSFFY